MSIDFELLQSNFSPVNSKLFFIQPFLKIFIKKINKNDSIQLKALNRPISQEADNTISEERLNNSLLFIKLHFEKIRLLKLDLEGGFNWQKFIRLFSCEVVNLNNLSTLEVRISEGENSCSSILVVADSIFNSKRNKPRFLLVGGNARITRHHFGYKASGEIYKVKDCLAVLDFLKRNKLALTGVSLCLNLLSVSLSHDNIIQLTEDLESIRAKKLYLSINTNYIEKSNLTNLFIFSFRNPYDDRLKISENTTLIRSNRSSITIKTDSRIFFPIFDAFIVALKKGDVSLDINCLQNGLGKKLISLGVDKIKLFPSKLRDVGVSFAQLVEFLRGFAVSRVKEILLVFSINTDWIEFFDHLSLEELPVEIKAKSEEDDENYLFINISSESNISNRMISISFINSSLVFSPILKLLEMQQKNKKFLNYKITLHEMGSGIYCYLQKVEEKLFKKFETYFNSVSHKTTSYELMDKLIKGKIVKELIFKYDCKGDIKQNDLFKNYLLLDEKVNKIIINESSFRYNIMLAREDFKVICEFSLYQLNFSERQTLQTFFSEIIEFLLSVKKRCLKLSAFQISIFFETYMKRTSLIFEFLSSLESLNSLHLGINILYGSKHIEVDSLILKLFPIKNKLLELKIFQPTDNYIYYSAPKIRILKRGFLYNLLFFDNLTRFETNLAFDPENVQYKFLLRETCDESACLKHLERVTTSRLRGVLTFLALNIGGARKKFRRKGILIELFFLYSY